MVKSGSAKKKEDFVNINDIDRRLIYLLDMKPIGCGSISYIKDITDMFGPNLKVVNPCGHGTRAAKDLYAILMVDVSPSNQLFYGSGSIGRPICVIGAVERERNDRLREELKTANLIGDSDFVETPKGIPVCTPTRASRYLDIRTYRTLLNNIKTADDILELRGFMEKFLYTEK